MSSEKKGRGFFDKLKDAVPYINAGILVADKAGVPGAGAAGAVIDQVLGNRPGGASSVSADGLKALAVAVDDHEGDIHELREENKEMRAELRDLKGQLRELLAAARGQK